MIQESETRLVRFPNITYKVRMGETRQAYSPHRQIGFGFAFDYLVNQSLYVQTLRRQCLERGI